MYDFAYAFHINYASLLYRVRTTARYCQVAQMSSPSRVFVVVISF